MALPQTLPSPAPEAYRLADVRIRRCVFRRIATVGELRQGRDPVYEVHCLLPGLRAPVTIGDFGMATGVCNECTAEGTFRPDED
ncbi:MAG: hypothetical protein WCH74_13140 [Chloroflexota bacterium]